MQTLVIIGAGGFGKEAAWVAGRMNAVTPRFSVAGFCDDRAAGASHAGHVLLGSIEHAASLLSGPVYFYCAIGTNATREKVVARALAAGWFPCAPLIDPSVIIGPGVDVGAGSYVGAGSILSPDCRIGEHVIVNQHCSIGHDAIMEDYAQACPGSRVNGECVVMRAAFIGSGAVLKQGVRVAGHAVLGAASFAVKDVPAGATAIGNPARVIFQPPAHS